MSGGGGSGGGGGGSHDASLEDKVRKLESDKESLMLQVSVLTDQVEAQGHKISDMFTSMDDSRSKLRATEKMLQSVSTQVSGVHTHARLHACVDVCTRFTSFL